MSLTGKVRNGVVVHPPGAHLPEGTEVTIEPVTPGAETDELLALAEMIARPRPHWPKDYVRNPDHYLYGSDREI